MAAAATPPPIEIGLHAAIVAVADQQPLILAVGPNGSGAGKEPDNLPFGPFNPLAHRTFETGLREWVAENPEEAARDYAAGIRFTEPTDGLPLRTGLSASVEVDLKSGDGAAAAEAPAK